MNDVSPRYIDRAAAVLIAVAEDDTLALELRVEAAKAVLATQK